VNVMANENGPRAGDAVLDGKACDPLRRLFREVVRIREFEERVRVPYLEGVTRLIDSHEGGCLIQTTRVPSDED
jgi:hypothetical protein